MFLNKRKEEQTLQEKHRLKTSDKLQKVSKDNHEKRYTPVQKAVPIPNVRQAKSIRSLQQELEKLKITDQELIDYAIKYDALENIDLTKSDQMQILKKINEILLKRSEFKYDQARKLINTEMYIVLNQNTTLPLKRPSLWKRIEHDPNAGLVYRPIVKYDYLSVKNTSFAIGLLTEARDFIASYHGQELVLQEETKKIIDNEINIIKNYMIFPSDTTKIIRSHVPYEAMEKGQYWSIIESFQPEIAGMSVKGKINAFSEKHLQFLDDLFKDTLAEATDRDYLLDTFHTIKERVKTLIRTEGVLAHYSHAAYLTTLESNDQLRESGMLTGETLLLKKIKSDTFGADKTQEFDKRGIGNTGFVFCFLEEANGPLRKSRFGKNRYTKMLAGDESILNDAWVIMNDLAETIYNTHPYKFTENNDKEIIIRDVITNTPEDLKPPYITKNFPDEKFDYNILYCSLMNFQNALKKRTYFSTSNTKKSEYFEERELGSNFLYGPHILEGVASRTAAELAFAHVKLGANIDKFKTDDKALWNYIRQVVFKMQIMIPLKVIPDFIRKGYEEKEEIVTVAPSEYITLMEIPEWAPGRKFYMVTANPVLEETVGGNNNFFACVKSVVAPDLSAEELRKEFQHKSGGILNDTEPVTLDHIEQFAKIYGVKIKVYIYVQGMRPINVTYNQEAKQHCAVALFLPRLRYEGDNPVGLFVPVKIES